MQEYGITGNNAYQNFNIEYQKEGFYKITVCHTGKSLTVKNNNIKSGEQIIQNDYKGEIGQKWIIRDSNINGWTFSPISRLDLSITIEGNIQNGSKLILSKFECNNNQMFYLYNVNKSIDSKKYPGIAEKINKLSSSHPNWEFEFLYTTIDFNTAVQAEYEYANKQGNLVYTPTYKGDWIAPSPYVSGVWASASYKGIAYFMDPRNFLNDVEIFQFADLSNYSSSGATLASIQYQVNDTYLQNYSNDIKRICENVNINPYYVIARLIQEQGKNGSGTINMDGGDGKKYYNPFNIGAEVGKDIPTALARAKKEGWDTMAKGIEGGMRIIKSYYIDKKQHTLYLNKFDVNPESGGGFYNHQYMQNLSAAYSEAGILRDCYLDTKALNNRIKFIIPIYENMPKNNSEKPTGKSANNVSYKDSNCYDKVMVSSSDGVNVRSGPGTNYNIVRAVPYAYKGIRIKTGIDYCNNLWWDKVVLDDGTVGYIASNYLKKIN